MSTNKFSLTLDSTGEGGKQTNLFKSVHNLVCTQTLTSEPGFFKKYSKKFVTSSHAILPPQVFYLLRYFTSSGILPPQVFYLLRYFTSSGILPPQIFYLLRLKFFF